MYEVVMYDGEVMYVGVWHGNMAINVIFVTGLICMCR